MRYHPARTGGLSNARSAELHRRHRGAHRHVCLQRRLCHYLQPCVITFNQLLDTPENITVTSGSILTKLEQAARKRYLVKQTTNGTVAAPLLASNTAFFEDSAAAPILGTDGDVMNPLPEFYYKIERDEAAKEVLLYIAENDPDGTYKHIPASWVGTYKASMLDGELRSISGAEPCRGEVWNDLKAAATQRGEGFELVGYDQHCVIALLLYGCSFSRSLFSLYSYFMECN